jgi:hypothetical protein
VVDYKTGKPKTMGQIEGTTQDSDGELRRQLEFYKLLIDSDPSLNYKFGEGMLDFVEEPGLKGKSGERRFLVTDQQIEQLKQTILASMASIRRSISPAPPTSKSARNVTSRITVIQTGYQQNSL